MIQGFDFGRNGRMAALGALLTAAASLAGASDAHAKLTLSAQGRILGAIPATGKVSDEVKMDILAIVGGQSYENRVSLLPETSCWQASSSASIYCEFFVGRDDLNDGDTGWGTVYKISVKASSSGSTIKTVKVELVAG